MNGWTETKQVWYKKYLKWGWWRKRSYSVTYKDIGLEGIRVTARQRIHLTRSEKDQLTKDYKFVKRMNPDGSIVISDGKTDETISFATSAKLRNK